MGHRLGIFLVVAAVAACGSSDGQDTSQGTSSASGTSSSAGGAATSSTTTSASAGTGGGSTGGGGCTLAENTSKTSTVSAEGCYLLDRDTSACEASRKQAGLSGYWLKFSCRVQLSMTDNGVAAVTSTSDDQPDYPSFYFSTSDPCYEAWAEGTHNPNSIVAQTITLTFPTTPDTTAQSMQMHATVGLALNGVAIYGNFAAPGDDIYTEAVSFDKCAGHPQMSGIYHYHSEPTSITNDDDRFVGVMRDGYPIYGRRDPDGTTPTDLDAYGGHTSATVDSDTPVYHYHVNKQFSMNQATFGESQWFLTTGSWRGTPGSCTGAC